ncbi:MAG TPA: transposase [Allosphingosinicella sp.]|nr:transposase [Allosphingosinicella sp.]
MPRIIHADTNERIELGDLVELLETDGFDPRDEENFASFGPALKKLANNRTFLADLVIQELKDRCANQLEDNQYSSQVIMLPVRSSKFAMRANFWPGRNDSVVINSGINPFFYGVPHDHNFSFLTVGYLGPGYWSEYYEFDYEQVVGFTGEKVDLRFVEKSRLEQGKVMLYRTHKDVHNQLPADEMSISLNILETDYSIGLRDQYRFDLEAKTVDGILTTTPLDPLLAISAHFGGGNGRDLLDSFAERHPSDRIRFKALQARAGAAASLDERIAIYEQAARTPNRFVAAMAAREAAALERGRGWIEREPAVLA